MATYLICTAGPLVGQRFELNNGTRLGRDDGDIILNDPKASGTHAIIKKSLLGGLTLIDQKSKNGIYHEKVRVDKLRLEDGLDFRIGDNFFRVEVLAENAEPLEASLSSSEESLFINDENLIDDSPDDPAGHESPHEETFVYEPDSPEEEHDANNNDLEHTNISELSLKELTANPSRPSLTIRTLESPDKNELVKKEELRKTWSQILEPFSRKHIKEINDKSSSLQPLSPRVKLTFFRGPQAETEWELGYGPRSAGRNSVDLPLLDINAPPNTSFEILPSPEGPLFKTKYPNEVKINGSSKQEVTLQTGDIISISETQIEVELF
ncbi:MAG: FHA domain-containing protein [Bdellovibrionales bacterium]|nr:FHA domain-containing protein [Bdellovibrionales bacterium]